MLTCDLDADGIGIIDVISRELQRSVTPVGMDIDLWRSAPHRKQDADQIARDKEQGAKLAARGPGLLRPLASEIAMYGGSCEQEAIQDQVIPNLARMLSAIALTQGDS